MNWTLTCQKFGVLFVLLAGLVGQTIAQSITVSSNVSPSANVCAGSSVQLTFSTSGTFTTGNTFSLQRSDENGTFPATPTVLGTLAAVPTSATTLTVSGTLDAGVINATGYRFRVVSSAPVRTSNPTPPNALTIGVALPDASPASACQNSGNLTLSAEGQNVEWYNSATATIPNGTGATYSVSTANSATYYVTQTINGCRSAKRSVVVSITSRPGAPTVNGTMNGSTSYCPGAGGQLTAAGAPGATFRWINNRNSTVATTATINAPAQTTSYTVTQSVSGCESTAFATFTATVNPIPDPPTISDASPAYCPANSPGTLTASTVGSGNSIRWVLPNGTQVNAASIPAPTASGAYTVYQVNGNGCLSNPLAVNVTVFSVPAAPGVSDSSPDYCPENAPAALTANAVSGNSLRWYVPGQATPLNQATVPAPSTAGTYSYSVSQVSSNGCESLKTQITVTVHGSPTAAPTISQNPVIYCVNNRPASLTAAGTGLKWYSTSGTFLGNNSIAPPTASASYDVRQSNDQGCVGPPLRVNVTVNGQPGNPGTSNVALCQNDAPQTLTASGSNLTWYQQGSNMPLPGAPTPLTSQANSFTVYEVTQTDGNGCVSDRSTLRFDVKALPTAPGVGSFSACQNASLPAFTASGANGSTLKWYDGNDALLPGTPAPSTSTPGSTPFKVSQTVNGCEGPKANTTFTVYGLPAQPTLGAPYNYCQTQAPASLTASGSNIRWYNQSGGFLANNTLTAPTAPGTYVYQVTQSDSRSCQSPFLNVPVQVRATPGPPSVANPVFCQGRAAQQLTATGDNLAWFDAAGASLPNAPTPGTTALGQQRFYVNQTNAVGCTSTTALVTVTVNAIPANPNITTPRAYCAGEATEPLSATGTALRWYDAPTGGTGSAAAIRPATSTNPTDLTTAQSYYVTQTVAGCESERQAITVTIKRKPGLPTNVPNTAFCQTYSAPALTATPESGAALVWVYNGTDNSTPPTVPNNAATTYTYQVAQTLNGCRSDNAPFQVRVKSTPGQPTITPFSLCQGRGTRALQANGTDLKYYDANNNLLGSAAPSPSTDQATTLTYRVSQSTDGCEGPKIDYSVIVYPIPAQPGVSNLTYCLTQQDQPAQDVRPLTAVGQNLRWYNTDNNSFPSAPTPNINALIEATYLVTQTVNNCESERARLNVRVVTTATPVVPASVLTYCRNDPSSPIVVTAPTGSTLVWTGPDGFTFPQVPGGQGPTPPTINATKGGEQYRVFAIGTNGCYSARAFIGLVVNTNPTATISGSTTVNYGQTATLRLRFTSQPPYSYTLTDGTTGTATDTLASVAVRPLQTTLYQVASVSNVCGGGQPVSSATVFVTIPTITTQALTGSNTLCAGTSFVVGYSTTGRFNQGNAFKVQIADTTSKNYIDVSGVTPGSPITANLPANLRGGPYFVRVLATNPGAEVPGQNSPTLLTVKGLPGATLTGTQNVYETYPASLTIALTGDGPWAVTYQAVDGQPESFNTSANPHILTVRPAKTTTYQLVSVSNNCASTTALSGTAVVTVLPLLAVEDPLTGALTLFPIPTHDLLTVAIDLPLTPQQPAALTLSDLTGRPVLTRTTESRQTQLDLSQQPAGLYLLNVQVGDKRAVRKVMKL